MKFVRRVRLLMAPLWFCAFGLPLAAQTPPQQTPPAGNPPQQQQQQPQQPPRNPFENVPQQPTQQPPTTPPPAAPKPAPGQPQIESPKPAAVPRAPVAGEVIDEIEFRGARRVPQDTLRAMIISKRGDLFNEEVLRRDFMSLWNTGRFDDIRLETESGPNGLLLRFVLTERRVIRSINYEGIKSVTVSEILDRFKERKVGLSVESQ
jgi:outer membrane protein insertion porin family